MNFDWTDEQRAYHDTIVDFARARLGAEMGPRDREHRFSREDWTRCAEVGIQGLPVPARYGGTDAPATTIVLALEALGYGCRDNGLTFALGAQMWACTLPLVRFGSEAQRERYLPGLCDGSMIAAQAVSEPEAGSDALAMASRALVQDDSSYLLSGRKIFVTNAPEADVLLVYASTQPRDRALGLSAFLIARDTPGLTIGPRLEKMGLRTSPMSEVFLDDCRVSSEHVLGRPGMGMTIFNVAMLWERGCILAGAIGAMRHQLERCVAYARSRSQFGRPIGDFQAVSHRIAEMKLRLESSRLLVYRLAWLLEQGQAKAEDAALVKLHVGESYLSSSLDALQIHGGYGYMAELELEREVRDAVGTRIHSGTSEILRSIVASGLGL
jgi:alkylation response protein AidB-like acyl-CoA dehydrogenase